MAWSLLLLSSFRFIRQISCCCCCCSFRSCHRLIFTFCRSHFLMEFSLVRSHFLSLSVSSPEQFNAPLKSEWSFREEQITPLLLFWCLLSSSSSFSLQLTVLPPVVLLVFSFSLSFLAAKSLCFWGYCCCSLVLALYFLSCVRFLTLTHFQSQSQSQESSSSSVQRSAAVAIILKTWKRCTWCCCCCFFRFRIMWNCYGYFGVVVGFSLYDYYFSRLVFLWECWSGANVCFTFTFIYLFIFVR